MPMSVNYHNAIANHGRTLVTHVSLHTGNPGATGASEVAGGSPAYARVAITWATASGGNIDSSNTPTFNVPAGTTVTHVGFWSAATGGTFYGSDAVTAETFAGQGTYQVTDADILHQAA